jgi:hypothetical protein
MDVTLEVALGVACGRSETGAKTLVKFSFEA